MTTMRLKQLQLTVGIYLSIILTYLIVNRFNDNYEKICLAIKERCDFTNINEDYEEVKGLEHLKINLFSLESSGSKFYNEIKHDYEALNELIRPHTLKCISSNIRAFKERVIESENLEEQSCQKDLELYAYLSVLEETKQHDDFVNSVEVIVQQTNRKQLIGNRQQHLNLADEVNSKQMKLDEGYERARQNYLKKKEEIEHKEREISECKNRVSRIFQQLVDAYNGEFTDIDDCPKSYKELVGKQELFNQFRGKLLHVNPRF